MFQQDGAPAHFARRIRGILNENLENRWIGRGARLKEWPPRSPDLTVCDYFLWGYLKDQVYSHNITNLIQLKKIIKEEILKVPLEMIQDSVDSILNRCAKCLEYEGGHFEMFLG
uniref:Tc1-like transposase DDE domain-containing protein n=1 Tax=Strongyloides stercoralis TaxID=6248 RepID=A0A0K0EGZ0_STRER